MNNLLNLADVAYAVLRRNAKNCSVQLGYPAPDGLCLQSVREASEIEKFCARIQRNCGELKESQQATADQDASSDPEMRYPKLISRLPNISQCSANNAKDDRHLVLNPNYKLSRPGIIPREITDAFFGFDLAFVFDFTDAYQTLWIKDPSYDLWWPYNLDESQVKLLRSRDPAFSAVLQSIQFLLPRDWDSTHTNKFNGSFWRLNNFLNPLQRRTLAKYFSDLMQRGLLRKGDYQTRDRYWAHNDAVSRYIQLQTLNAVRRVSGIDWEPTFTSFLGYEYPADLSCHTDREQAALTVSLLIDYRVHQVESEDQWQIFVENPESESGFDSIYIGLGNAIAFQGSQKKHYRNGLLEGHRSRSLCFHYAKPGFQGKRF